MMTGVLLRHPRERLPHGGEILRRVGIAGREPERGLELALRLAKATGVEEHDAEVRVRGGPAGIEAHCLPEQRDRLLEPALPVTHDAQVVGRVRVGWIESPPELAELRCL